MADERQVRTMAGWIGVEISRSRVRTPGKAGYGLYRVRSAGVWRIPGDDLRPGARFVSEPGAWTPYAFEIGIIETAIRNSLIQGRPERPMDLAVVRSDVGAMDENGMIHVETRWTSAYRGSRTPGQRETPDERAQRLSRQVGKLGTPIGLAGCGCPNRIDYAPPDLHLCRRCGFTGGWVSVHERCAGCAETVRSRQRAANGEFQAEHKVARDAGLKVRHATKLARNARGSNSE